MHELSIAQSILEIVRQNLPPEKNVSVTVVRLRIGAMAGVLPDSLEFCFTAITQGTPAEGATLEIEHVPLAARCGACGRESEIAPTKFICPLCGGSALTVVSGREMQVREIEIEDGNGKGP